MKHIYRLELKEPVVYGTIVVDSGNFTSLAAIYEEFTEDQIGIKLESLWHHKITENNPYRNKKCTITKERIYSKPQQNKQ